MGLIKKKVKGNLYDYFRDEERHEIYLGPSGSEQAVTKLRDFQRQRLLGQIKVLRTKLETLNGYHPKPVKVDLSSLPLNKFICGDALQVMKQLPEGSIHFAATSPPYNLGLPYDIYTDDKEYDSYREGLKKIWEQTFRVLVDGGRFALNIAPTGIANFREVHHDLVRDAKDVGFTLRTEILWYKQNMGRHTAWGSWKSPSNPHIIPSWEYVYVFHKKTPYLEGKKEDIDITAEEFKRFSDGFWNIIPETRNRNGHPSPFPEELIRRLVKYYTYRGNICLDMFAGTGTVGLVALKTGRQFICIDISKQYCEIAEKRLADYLSQKKIEVPIHGLEAYR